MEVFNLPFKNGRATRSLLQATQLPMVRACVREYMKTPRVTHTCEVLQRRAVHPEAEHLLHRQIKGRIPVG